METVDDLAELVFRRLGKVGVTALSLETVRAIFRVVYAASLIREEGRFTQGSVTVADPHAPDLAPPMLRRAHYPSFHPLGSNETFTSEAFAKLSRAVDRWSGSVAIWGKVPNDLHMWGIVDQLVGTNIYLHQEDGGGFANPGMLAINVDGPGELTAYHDSTFLGAFVAQRIVRRESNGLSSEAIHERLALPLAPTALAIAEALQMARPPVETELASEDVFKSLAYGWTRSVSRICIGLRRAGTGGALIFSPVPRLDILSLAKPFMYERLASAFALHVQDELYHHYLWVEARGGEYPDEDHASAISSAETDADDRQKEVQSCVKFVASLASVDGSVLLRPDLTVLGFGVKINAPDVPPKVFDGPSYLRDPATAKLVDISRFGTRHSSMLKYCVADPDAFGIVISQDGQVRVILNVEGNVLLWDTVKLLAHGNFTDQGAKLLAQARPKKKNTRRLGYTDTPKTMTELLSVLFKV